MNLIGKDAKHLTYKPKPWYIRFVLWNKRILNITGY